MKKNKTKKKTIRNSKKYPALEKSVNLKTRQDLVDYDYLNKLSPDELEFLNKFTEETVSTSFTKKNGKYSGNLHKKKSQKKELWNSNNSRNRCQYTRAKAMGILKDGETVVNHLEDKSNMSTNKLEDHLIDILSSTVEPTIDFIDEGYEQIMTKGGLRWKKKLSK